MIELRDMSSFERERTTPGGWRQGVLVADANPVHVAWLQRVLGGRYELTVVDSAAEVRAALAREPHRLLIAGERLRDGSGVALLAELRESGRSGDVSLFIADNGDRGPLPPEGTVFYVLRPGLPTDDVQALVTRAAEWAHGEVEEVSSVRDAARLQRILELARRLAVQTDLRGAGGVAVDAVLELSDADRAYCLFYDADSGSMWTEGGDELSPDERTAARGVAGFAARTGRSVALPCAADDARYDRATDDPAGRGDERLLVQPVATTSGEIHAVLVAVRGARRPAFGGEREAVAQLAEQWGPLLHQLALQVQAEAVIEDERRVQDEDGLFRREAVEAYATRGHRGDVVRVSPAWLSWTYWLLLGVLVSGVVYLAVGTIHQYSSGPSVVRVSGRTEIPAPSGGEVEAIAVRAGQRVRAGDLLVRLDSEPQQAELAQATREWETQLREYLLDPSHEAARRAVAAVRTRRDQARAALEERVVRAPTDGVVNDVLVREGLHVVPGDLMLSLGEPGSELYLVALLPGGDRPRIEPGMPMRLELAGHQYAYQTLTVESVNDEVLGPAAARRFLGPSVGDTLPIVGPVVIVRARLPRSTFEADGHTYDFHDGMQGIAEVRLDSESILETVIPGLKRL